MRIFIFICFLSWVGTCVTRYLCVKKLLSIPAVRDEYRQSFFRLRKFGKMRRNPEKFDQKVLVLLKKEKNLEIVQYFFEIGIVLVCVAYITLR